MKITNDVPKSWKDLQNNSFGFRPKRGQHDALKRCKQVKKNGTQKHGIKGIIICASVAFLCGCVWELLQYVGVLSRTGDIHDIIMYFLASAICIIINLKETREK